MYYVSWQGQNDRLGVYLTTLDEVKAIEYVLKEANIPDVEIVEM